MYSSMNKSAAVIVYLAFCFLVAAYAQQPEDKSDSTSRGIALYERGDTEGAIKTLREAVKDSKKDAKAWNYLGLALIRQGKSQEAVQVFSKAIDLRTKAINLEFSRNEAWRDDRLMSLKALLGGQIESRSKLLEIISEKQALEKGQLDLETSKVQAACVEQNTRLGVDGQPALRKSDLEIQRPKILFKTEPVFPRGARDANVRANVSFESRLRRGWLYQVYRNRPELRRHLYGRSCKGRELNPICARIDLWKTDKLRSTTGV